MSKLGRPSTPLISKIKATQAALHVINTQGLEALSLGEVAKRLNVKAPSLYHHFHNKAELLTEVARSILRQIRPTRNDDATWEESFVELCVATRRTILRHANAAPLLLQYFPRSLLLSAYDFWTAKCPYPKEFQMVVLDGAEKLTFGSSLYGAAAKSRDIDAMPVFDKTRLPALAAAIEHNAFTEEELFIEEVKVFLAGLKARYAVAGTPVTAVKKKAVAPVKATAKAKPKAAAAKHA